MKFLSMFIENISQQKLEIFSKLTKILTLIHPLLLVSSEVAKSLVH